MAPRTPGIVPAALLAMALGTAATAAAAQADLAFEATMEPRAISFSDTRELSYRLQMTSGDREERFRVRVEQPAWDPLAERGPPGFPIVPDCFRTPLALEGPGSLAGTACVPKPARRQVCHRGSSRWDLSGEVTLPPHSSSTLVARFLAGGPPLRRTDYRATFALGGGVGDTLTGEQEIRPAKPAVLGPFGSTVSLSTRPSTPHYPAHRRFRSGRVIHIRGRVERSLRGQVIVLRYGYLPPHGRSGQRTIARVRIGRDGRFGYRGWRPTRPGSYRLFAVHPSRTRGRVTDYSCGRGIRVRG